MSIDTWSKQLIFTLCKTRSYEPILDIISSWIYTFIFRCLYVIFSIILCEFDSKAFNRFLDYSRIVHVSQPYKRVDIIKEV